MIYDIVVSAQPVEEECIMRGYVRIVWSDSLVVSSSGVRVFTLPENLRSVRTKDFVFPSPHARRFFVAWVFL